MFTEPKQSSLMLLTKAESSAHDKSGLTFKQFFQMRLGEIKASIQSRKDISDADYRALLKDRQRLIRLIEVAKPLMMNKQKLYNLGIPLSEVNEIWGDLQASPEINNGFDTAKLALEALVEGVFDRNLTRQEFKRQGLLMGAITVGDFDKAEMCIDYVIWIVSPYLEIMCEMANVDRIADLMEHHIVALDRYAVANPKK